MCSRYSLQCITLKKVMSGRKNQTSPFSFQNRILQLLYASNVPILSYWKSPQGAVFIWDRSSQKSMETNLIFFHSRSIIRLDKLAYAAWSQMDSFLKSTE